MPRQRSKKLSATRKAETANVAKNPSENVQHEEDIESDNESVDILEKDAEEEELDRLVLGGGFGFKAQYNRDAGMPDAVSENEEDEDVDQDSEGEAGLEGLDDADVKYLQMYSHSKANPSSSFSLTRAPLQSMRLYYLKLPRTMTDSINQLGKIVTTIDWKYHWLEIPDCENSASMKTKILSMAENIRDD
jgi:hypothetical protein